MTHEQYMLTLHGTLKEPKLFIKMNMKDICINLYVKGLVKAWQANYDIQYVLDAYSCVMHIHDCLKIAKKGMSALIAEA